MPAHFLHGMIVCMLHHSVIFSRPRQCFGVLLRKQLPCPTKCVCVQYEEPLHSPVGTPAGNSIFFSVKRIEDPIGLLPGKLILGINKRGVHFFRCAPGNNASMECAYMGCRKSSFRVTRLIA